MSGPFYGNISFEMATDTHRVAAIRIEMRRIDNRIFAAATDMQQCIPVTCFAGNPTV